MATLICGVTVEAPAEDVYEALTACLPLARATDAD
jgi:hypothetical protein